MSVADTSAEPISRSLSVGMRGLGPRLRRPALAIALVYFVILGGTPAGDVSGRMLFVNILVGAAFVWVYIQAVGADHDLVDELILAAFLLFLIPGLTSEFPRASLDVALSTFGLVAIFHFARRELRDEAARRWLFAVLTGIALVVGLAALASWGGLWILWLSELGLPPPREAPFAGLVFGHRHDVAILLLLCLPAAIGWKGLRGRTVAVLVLGIVLAAVALEGSRNVWLAALASTAVVGGAVAMHSRTVVRPSARTAFLALAGAAVVIGLLGVSGLWERMTTLATLESRIDLWRASLEVWRADPVTGMGPGSFPWLLHMTDYFADHGFNPRHPDNALVQLLSEAGIAGVMAAGIVVGAVVVGIRRAGWPGARALWSLTFFGFACLFANPTDFGFLVILALAWAALATPPATGPAQPARLSPRRWPHRTAAILATIILFVAGGLAVAAIAYDEAARVDKGRPDEADTWLRLAAAMDPRLALYQRELGLRAFGRGQLDEASELLRRASELNPWDAITFRALAEAELGRGEIEAAVQAALFATREFRSAPGNLMTLARAVAAQGDLLSARALVAEAVMRNPALLAEDMQELGVRMTTQQALDEALNYWRDGKPASELVGFQAVWLVALAGEDALLAHARDVATRKASQPEAGSLVDLIHLTLSCRLADAKGLSDSLQSDLSGWPGYWETRYLLERMVGYPERLTLRIGLNLSDSIRRAEGQEKESSALAAVLTDSWGYGRVPALQEPIAGVPRSMGELSMAWLRNARATASRTLPMSPLARCQGMASASRSASSIE